MAKKKEEIGYSKMFVKKLKDDLFNKYFKNGLNTDPLNMDNINPILEYYYGNKKAKTILKKLKVFKSPLDTAKWIMKNKPDVNIEKLVINETYQKSLDVIAETLYNAKVDIGDISPQDTPERNMTNLLIAIKAAIFNGVAKEDEKLANYLSHLQGNLMSEIYYTYEYVLKRYGNLIKDPDIIENIKQMLALSEFSYIYFFDDECFLIEKPIKIGVKNNRLHADGCKSIEYSDGFGAYHLNGVAVPEWLVMTSAHKLDPKELTSNKDLKNVEIRREFIRKIGIERCLSVLQPKVLDTKDSYELLEINIGDNNSGSRRIYLKMLNPSVKGVYHLEAVAPECKTVQDAINWRAGGVEWNPVVLT